jgi:hypothetical protein
LIDYWDGFFKAHQRSKVKSTNQWFYIALCGLLVYSYEKQAYRGPKFYPENQTGVSILRSFVTHTDMPTFENGKAGCSAAKRRKNFLTFFSSKSAIIRKF